VSPHVGSLARLLRRPDRGTAASRGGHLRLRGLPLVGLLLGIVLLNHAAIHGPLACCSVAFSGMTVEQTISLPSRVPSTSSLRQKYFLRWRISIL
jgi:hypothetical protein